MTMIANYSIPTKIEKSKNKIQKPMTRLIIIMTILALTNISLHSENARITAEGGVSRLMVDNKPMLIIGGELGNSSATCDEDVESIFPRLKRMGLNTALVPAYWELIEPTEGIFDFSTTEKVIEEANKNDLKVVFLWFGAWKNSMSCYAPSWFKEDTKRFPRARTKNGKPLEIASAFSEEVFRADSTAFSKWLEHMCAYDKGNTMIMLQIENEIGMLEDARDYSEAAQKEYHKGVTEKLIDYLNKNKKSLHGSLMEKWSNNGMKGKGSWAEVFGDDIFTDEYFMAWNYARYVERLAKRAREITDIPLYVNAAMNSRGRKPGEYPSAGPLIHLKDIWHAAAPSLSFLSPDLYDNGFTDWVASYSTPDNILFIPEIKRGDGNAVQALYVFGEHDAIGLSPFSIENGSDSSDSPNVKGNRLIRALMPLLIANQGKGNMNGLYFDSDSTKRILTNKDLKITAEHYFTLPWDPHAADKANWKETGGVIIRLTDNEYIIAGTGIVVKFEHKSESAATAKLGEDGFSEKGGQQSTATGWDSSRQKRIGLSHVAEVRVNPDGSFTPVRHLNGDETHQGRHVRIPVDDYKILHVKLYEYQ